MPVTLVTRQGTLLRKVAERSGIEIWVVEMDEAEAEAVLYPELIGAGSPGERVLLNTTAVALSLGTGGQHFVMGRGELAGPPAAEPVRREDGHIMKLRYTPLQVRVRAAEEEASPHHELLREADSLPGTPVICLGLHSQLAPALGGVKASAPDLRVAFVMTDSAALPLAYSRLAHQLRQAGLLDITVTAGQAFGGDLEAVNVYSGLVTAALAGEADVIIAGQGPGNVGTASRLGFGSAEQALLVNAAAALGGLPIAVPRISFADARERHQGMSHHTLTVLGRLALAPAVLALPTMRPEEEAIIQGQLAAGKLSRHRAVSADGTPGIEFCQQHGIALSSMGREYDEDPLFFQAPAAAGRLAAEEVQGMRARRDTIADSGDDHD